MEQTKRGTKESWKRQQNKELTRGSRMKADLYGTRLEGDITEAAQIGKSTGIDWKWRRLLDHEGEGSAGVKGRQNERDLDRKL